MTTVTTVHIVTSRFPPQIGGLEQWTQDLGTALREAGLRPIVYVCEDPLGVRQRPSPFEIVDVARLRAPWEEPLLASAPESWRFEQERSRLTFACLRTELAKRTGSGPDVILSNFVTTTGFTAHLVSEALGLPHVAVIAGTDFTRGVRSRIDRRVFWEVCRAASVVVGRNLEQVDAVRRQAPGTRCELIETSVEPPTRRWRRAPGPEITVFSDGGFNFKKGTGVLMDAFVALRSRGVPARLVVCGGDQRGQEAYWAERRRLLAGLAVSFPGYLGRDEIAERIRAADIYASATLGEGSSAARALALCLGVPLVSTACGELTEDPEASHIRLTPVGDAAGFQDALHDLATEMAAGALKIDERAVERFRRRFEPRREWAAWADLLRAVGAGRTPDRS